MPSPDLSCKVSSLQHAKETIITKSQYFVFILLNIIFGDFLLVNRLFLLSF